MGILLRSRRDFGHRDFFSRQESRRNPGKILTAERNSSRDPAVNLGVILAGKQKYRRPTSRQDPTANLIEILTGKQLLGGQNLAGMLLQISPGSSCSAAKIKLRS